ncbi:hypothetical protein AKJ16_DCAP24887 [Drosera capensis]
MGLRDKRLQRISLLSIIFIISPSASIPGSRIDRTLRSKNANQATFKFSFSLINRLDERRISSVEQDLLLNSGSPAQRVSSRSHRRWRLINFEDHACGPTFLSQLALPTGSKVLTLNRLLNLHCSSGVRGDKPVCSSVGTKSELALVMACLRLSKDSLGNSSFVLDLERLLISLSSKDERGKSFVTPVLFRLEVWPAFLPELIERGDS